MQLSQEKAPIRILLHTVSVSVEGAISNLPFVDMDSLNPKRYSIKSPSPGFSCQFHKQHHRVSNKSMPAPSSNVWQNSLTSTCSSDRRLELPGPLCRFVMSIAFWAVIRRTSSKFQLRASSWALTGGRKAGGGPCRVNPTSVNLQGHDSSWLWNSDEDLGNK